MDRIIDLRNTPPSDRAASRGSSGSSKGTLQPLNPHAISFVTCVNDATQYDICLRYVDALEIPSGHTVEKIAVLGATSMAEGYQRAMEASTALYKIYIHQDVYLVHRGLLYELLNLFRTYPRLGMVGVEGATRLPTSVLYSVNNPLHCYGRHWTYRRPGGPLSLLGPANPRRLELNRFRSFVGDYLPAIVVDGLFMATQYDMPWSNPLGGFELYDVVRAVEFIKAGLEVGIARQETTWCLHWGRLQEPSRQQLGRRQTALHHIAGVFRQLYPVYIGVPAQRFYEQHRRAAGWQGMVADRFGGVTHRRGMPEDFKAPDPARERLGVVIVMSNGREALLRALRALLPQCAALKEVECEVVVVDNSSTDGTVEAVRDEFPKVTVMANTSNDGLERGFNLGLRHVGFPNYVLVMHDGVEFSTGTLARMVSYLREHPSTAGVVASLTNADGTVQFQRLSPVELVPHRPRRPQLSSFVPTTCALVRGEVFFDVGLYDERFNSHNGDLEWSLRARRKGYEFVFLPEARVIQYHYVGSLKLGPATVAERFTADLWLLHKHGGRRWAVALHWAQRFLAKWLALRWRNDSEALRQIKEAMDRVESLSRKFREENRRPQLL